MRTSANAGGVRRHLAVGGDDARLRVPVAPAVRAPPTRCPRSSASTSSRGAPVQLALLVAPVDRALEALVHALPPRVLGGPERDVGCEQDGGVEQHEPLHVPGMASGVLEREAAAERVTEPERRRADRLLDRAEMVVDPPRRLAAAMPRGREGRARPRGTLPASAVASEAKCPPHAVTPWRQTRVGLPSSPQAWTWRLLALRTRSGASRQRQPSRPGIDRESSRRRSPPVRGPPWGRAAPWSHRIGRGVTGVRRLRAGFVPAASRARP